MEAEWVERMKGAARASPAELALLILVGIAIVGGSVLVFVRKSDPAAPKMQHIRPAGGAEQAAGPKASHAPAGTLLVHVAGMVAAPGVYELAKGSRIKDAIAAAGGPTEGGNVDALNLAAPLADGQKITVTRPGEPPPAEAPAGEIAQAASGLPGKPAQGHKVNLNTATAAELETLPSIGPVLADRILAFRQQKGAFSSIAQLKEIEGIGPKRFESLQELVTL